MSRPIAGVTPRGPFAAWLAVTVALVALIGWLRLEAYPTDYVPLTNVLPLLVCLWHRDLRLLWGMAACFLAMQFYKELAVLPADVKPLEDRVVFTGMQILNVLLGAGIVQLVLIRSARLEETLAGLERTNAELEASNEELAAREEEIHQQNEELQSQAEELGSQVEELNAQAQELQVLNEEIADRERTLDDLFDTTLAGRSEAENLARIGDMIGRLLGARAHAGALLEPDGDHMRVHPLRGLAPEQPALPRGATFGELVCRRDRAAFVPDLGERPDLLVPKLASGAAVRSAIAAPLRTLETAGTALEVYSLDPGPWTEHDLRVVQWLAGQAGKMLSNWRLRAEVEREHLLLRTVTEHASAALLLADQEGTCTYLNPAAAELVGIALQHATGRRLHDIVHAGATFGGHAADECPLHDPANHDGHTRDGHVERAELPGRAEFASIPVQWAAIAVFRGDRHAATVFELSDMRVRVAAEREREQLLESERAARSEAERASRAKDEFVATLSHELRTPLNAMLGWATILSQGVGNRDDLGKGLEVIERNARHQAQLISDLLDISRISSGKIRLDLASVDLSRIVAATATAIRPAAEVKGVQLEVRAGAIAGTVVGDAKRLEQIVWNLLSNAVKFTPAGGSVRVELAREGASAALTVEDTGEGIRPELLEQIFERYRQADTSATRRHGGLGLGLAISRHLAELHGGSIGAESDGPGHGARFTLRLPVRISDREPGCAPFPLLPAGRRADTAALSGSRVLVVDDERDARELIGRILADHGASIEGAGSAQEALAALGRERFELLISDIGMPGTDGYSLIQRLRADAVDGRGELPAIALTAFARAEDRSRALLAGFHAHLAKPVEPAELVALAAHLIGKRR